MCENIRCVRGTASGAEDEEAVRGEGTGEVMSSVSGVSLIPTTMCAGSRVGWTCAPAWKQRAYQHGANDIIS